MNIIESLYEQIDKNHLFRETISLKRYDYLKPCNTIDTNIYYVVSGSLKLSLLDNNDEHIVRFGYKNNFITAIDSFITGGPSEYLIQAIKRTKLKIVSKKDFLQFISESEERKTLWDLLLQNLVLQHIEREKDILNSSPQKRYERVLKRSPQLFQEIPNKYIASYLRMSPETLSRLKKS